MMISLGDQIEYRFDELDIRYLGNMLYAFLNNNEVVYIGMTRKGLSRVYSHVNEFEYTNVMVAPSDEWMYIHEAYLINKYKPKYNKEYKEDFSISIANVASLMQSILGGMPRRTEIAEAAKKENIDFRIAENGNIFFSGIDMVKLAIRLRAEKGEE